MKECKDCSFDGYPIFMRPLDGDWAYSKMWYCPLCYKVVFITHPDEET